MDMNKLTEKAQAAIAAAQRDAEQRHNTQLEPEHLLAALIRQENGVVPAILDKLGVPPAQASQRLDGVLGSLSGSCQPSWTNSACRLRRLANVWTGCSAVWPARRRLANRCMSRKVFGSCSIAPNRKPTDSRTISS